MINDENLTAKKKVGVNGRLILQDGQETPTSCEVLNLNLYQFCEDGHFGNPFCLNKNEDNITTIKAILNKERKKYSDFLECEKNEMKKKILKLSIKNIDEIKIYKLVAKENEIIRYEVKV